MTKSKTERALRAIVIGGRADLRELERARAEIEKQIAVTKTAIETAEGILNARGLPIPGKPGRRPKAVTPPAVVEHIAAQAAAAEAHFEGGNAKKRGSYERTPAQRLAISKRVKAQWAAKRAAAAQASAHA